jgi:HD-GYP domain-containing protein (c-di-GMP phosphodiesterase class II)
VVQIAECATVHAAIGGPDAAAAIVSERAGAAFDPQLAATFAGSAAELLAAAPDGSLWDGVLAAAPGGTAALAPHSLDEALAAMGEFSDLKSPYTVGHSAGVARLAEAAAGHAGLPASDAVHLRRSGLVHDLGRVCVSSTVWEKESSLTPDEWEQVRLHPYHGDRLLARSPGLAALAATASLHHERCDGSGYHRGVDGRSLPLPARLLAAADVYHAMIEPRAHRPAHSPEEAVGQLRDESRRGTLDADAVECVLIAAGQRPRRRRPGVAGLTAREVDVLRLVARGLATKQIAAELVITPKTADSHIQHIYTKIGVSTRAAATVFAMRQELLEPPGSSGELPM